MSDEINEVNMDENICNKDSLIEHCNKFKNGEENIDYIPSPTEGKIKVRGFIKYSELSKVLEEVDFKIKNKMPLLKDYSDETIEAAVWLYRSAINPTFSFDEALVIVENSGYWSQNAMMILKRISGITPEMMEALAKTFKQDTFQTSII